MSTASLILFVLAGVFMVWQVVLVGLAMSMILSGRYNTVKIGMFPLVLALLATLAGIMAR